jgi:hypothetical protein
MEQSRQDRFSMPMHTVMQRTLYMHADSGMERIHAGSLLCWHVAQSYLELLRRVCRDSTTHSPDVHNTSGPCHACLPSVPWGHWNQLSGSGSGMFYIRGRPSTAIGLSFA